MPTPVVVDTNISMAPNEAIIFRVRPSLVILVFYLVALVLLAIILVLLFNNFNLFSGIETGFLPFSSILTMLSLVTVAFVGLVLVLEYFTTFYTLTTRRVQKDTGILRRSGLSIPLSEMADLDVRQNFLGLLFNYGDIIMRSDSSVVNAIVFKNISAPKNNRELIENNLPN